MLKISIIIPYHNEKEEVIKPLLESIDTQKNIDFSEIEIFVVNNCDEPIEPKCLSDNTFKNIQPKLQYILSETKNLSGMSRQCGIDHSTGKYIMFCDDDDILYDDLVLFDLLEAVDKHTEDILRFEELVENVRSDGTIFATKVLDKYTLIHGKLYKTDYIKNNNITFSNFLPVAEDNYFNLHTEVFPYTYSEINRIIYVFKHNPNSVSRTSTREFIRKCMVSRCFAVKYLAMKYYGKLPDCCFKHFILDLLSVYSKAVNTQFDFEKLLALKTCCNLFYMYNIPWKQYIENNKNETLISNFIMTAFEKCER